MTEIINPRLIPLDLSVARVDQEFDVSGDFIGFFDTSNPNDVISVRVQDSGSALFPFTRGASLEIKTGKFSRIFVSNAALGAGRSANLVIGGPEEFRFNALGSVIVNQIVQPVLSNAIRNGNEIQNNQVSVGVASTLLVTVLINNWAMIEVVNLGGQDVFMDFGGAAVTSGLRLAPGETKRYFVYTDLSSTGLYGIVAANSSTVGVFAAVLK